MGDINNFYVRRQVIHNSQKSETRKAKAHGRITPTLKEELEKMVDELGYKSMSELVNEALTVFHTQNKATDAHDKRHEDDLK